MQRIQLRLYKAPERKEPYQHEFEKEALYAVKIFCCMAWLRSSPYVRRKYPRFRMTQTQLEREITIYEEKVFNEEGVPERDVIANILQPLVNINSVWQGEWTDSENAEYVLGLSSYASCRIGGEACRGDLEFEMGMMQNAVKWKEGAIGPQECFKNMTMGNSIFFSIFSIVCCVIIQKHLLLRLPPKVEETRYLMGLQHGSGMLQVYRGLIWTSYAPIITCTCHCFDSLN
jgi:hypothetical protein